MASDEFDVDAEPWWLFNFVYRVAIGGREAQGFDPTVTDADECQIAQLDDFIEEQDNVYAKAYLDEMNMNRVLYPIQQVSAPRRRVRTLLQAVTLTPRCRCSATYSSSRRRRSTGTHSTWPSRTRGV